MPQIAGETRDRIDYLNDGLDRALNLRQNKGELSYESVKYPDWATIGPKNIVIADLKIQPTKGIDFINVDIEIAKN